jgi:predicted O-methyltransferase YrrM
MSDLLDTATTVDEFLDGTLVHEDEALRQARLSASRTTMPQAAVSPTQGKWLGLLAQISGARLVLELGTLAGYSTIWLARAVGPEGLVVSLELEQQNATVARQNLEAAGVGDRTEILVGPAGESARKLIDSGAGPFDLFFVDADKDSYPEYLQLCIELAHPGSVIVGDNVIRHGQVIDEGALEDPRVAGAKGFLEIMGAHPALDASALQTVGGKGWDGFAIARVRS